MIKECGIVGTEKASRRVAKTRMLRVCVCAVAVALTAGILGAVEHVAAASPNPETIVLSIDVSGPQPVTTWTASGTFSDSGTAVVARFDHRATPSPQVGINDAVTVQTGQNGSFVLRLLFVAPNGPGTWTVLSGTGAYSALHGQGSLVETFVAVPVGVITVVCTGSVVVS